MNILVVFLWLVEQDWCETILEQMWGSTSLGRGGALSELNGQFHSGRTPGCQWGNLADGTISSKSWYFICSHRRWSDLLCSRRCLHDHPHQTLEKETLQYAPQLVKTEGEWCWYWRTGKHKGSRMKGGVFLVPARVLLQERETTAEGVRVKGVVWITEGTSLVRYAVQHLRSLSESEKRLCSMSETSPPDVPVTSVEPEDSVQTTSMRRILFKRPPNPLDRVEPPKRTRSDGDDHSALLSA